MPLKEIVRRARYYQGLLNQLKILHERADELNQNKRTRDDEMMRILRDTKVLLVEVEAL